MSGYDYITKSIDLITSDIEYSKYARKNELMVIACGRYSINKNSILKRIFIKIKNIFK